MKTKLLTLAMIVGLGLASCKKESFNPNSYTPVSGHTIQVVQLAWGLPTSIGATTYNDKGHQVVVHFYPNQRATITYVNGKVDRIDWQPK